MENELIIARIEDCAEICRKTEKPKFLGFLSLEQAHLAKKILEKRNVSFKFFGGFNEAQRVVLGCFPEWVSEYNFPVCAITFSFRKVDKLRHKDFLGSLMALGLKREAIGDILIEDGRAVVFCLDEISDYILKQVEKIGRIGVELKRGYTEPLPKPNELVEFSDTIASERLDCVVSSLCKISRSEAIRKIVEGAVSINSQTTEKITKTVSEGDALTVRGSGKFIIEAINEKTRKNRIVLKYKKYV